MKRSRVWTKVLFVVALVYGLSRFDGTRTRAESLQGGPVGSAKVDVPDLQFEEIKFNFGEIVQDEKVHHTYRFTNKGTATLEIGDVRASCGCTAALASAKSVAPGGSGSIDVTFDSKFKKGPVTKTITVNSNDPDSPQTTLVLEGTIRTFVEFDPQFVNLGNGLNKGQGAESKFRIWRTDGQSFQIQKLQSDNRSVTATSAPFEDGGRKGYEITVKLATDAPAARYSGAITVGTDIEKAPDTSVRYFASVRSDITINPKYAVLGNVQPGQEVVKTLSIQNAPDPAGQQLQITKVSTEVPGLRVALKTVEEGFQYELQVTLGKDAPKGSVRGNIELETNLKDEPKVSIPVFGYVGNPDEEAPPANPSTGAEEKNPSP